MTDLEFLDDSAQRRKAPALSFGLGETAHPAIENLQNLRSRCNLRRQVGNRRIDQDADQSLKLFRSAQRPAFDLEELLRSAALDHVTRNRPWSAGKANHRCGFG